MTRPIDDLNRAAQTLLDLADDTDEEIKTNAYWHSQHTTDWFANGIENAVGGPAGQLAGKINPAAARGMAKLFRAWARMGELDPGLLNRIGGPETIELARAIDGGQP
jgi:hypothetical protein